jgi:hypothetical protein
MTMTEEKVVKIGEVSGLMEAEIVRNILESNGIPVWLSHESAISSVALTVGPMSVVEVHVREEMADLARELIQAYLDGEEIHGEDPA